MTGRLAFCIALFFLARPAFGQAATSVPAATVWNAISTPAMDSTKYAHTENVEIVRDRIHITLLDGTISFGQPVNGVVFAAVFHGTGRVRVDPPNPIEAQQLNYFTKHDKLDAPFTDATFSFTDGVIDQVAKQVKWQPSAAPVADDLYIARQKAREDLGESALPRLLSGVLSTDHTRTAYFLADLKLGGKDWVEFHNDALDPEDINIGRWVDVGPFKHYDIWTAFPAGGVTSAEAWKDPQAKSDFFVRAYKIDSTVTSGAELHSSAQITIEPHFPGATILVFGLDSNLRVESIKDGQGNTLGFYQSRENKDRYQSYGNYLAIVLPQPLKTGNPLSLQILYGGKRAIQKAGSGNYFCESSGWYPALPNDFSTRADFDLTFRSPKNSILVATGEKTSEIVDGGTRVTTWKSEIPLAVAGFAYGDYKVSNDKAGEVSIDVYANRDPDDVMASVQRYFDSGQALAAVGSLSPSNMAKTMGGEMANTVRLFSAYFGPFPYKHLSVTSLPISFSYGQGWPGLIYLWSASFLDSTQRHAIGLQDQIGLTDFFRAHESSHQWWGHRVGWKSYHDQWLSEGFAEFSGNLYVQYRENMKEALGRWKKEKETLKDKDSKGHEVQYIGPIWMGQRIASSETSPRSYQDLIYSKGGYVLYMLREQLTDPRNQDPDHLFKLMMQDYCKTFDNKAASTEDFKAIVEKHMLRSMDLEGNHKMDWFFNQYVYGMGVPEYHFHATTEPGPDGKTHIKGELTRSGVPDSWKDVVPIYAHMGDKTTRLGSISATHSTETLDVNVPGKIDRLTINDFDELLAEVKQQ